MVVILAVVVACGLVNSPLATSNDAVVGAHVSISFGALEVVDPLIFSMLSVALFLTFFRLVRGPSLTDRVVALDLIAVITVGFVAVYAIDTGQRIFLDVAIVVALITFLGTVAFAQDVERRSRSA